MNNLGKWLGSAEQCYGSAGKPKDNCETTPLQAPLSVPTTSISDPVNPSTPTQLSASNTASLGCGDPKDDIVLAFF